jgi:hypothetical protein
MIRCLKPLLETQAPTFPVSFYVVPTLPQYLTLSMSILSVDFHWILKSHIRRVCRWLHLPRKPQKPISNQGAKYKCIPLSPAFSIIPDPSKSYDAPAKITEQKYG